MFGGRFVFSLVVSFALHSLIFLQLKRNDTQKRAWKISLKRGNGVDSSQKVKTPLQSKSVKESKVFKKNITPQESGTIHKVFSYSKITPQYPYLSRVYKEEGEVKLNVAINADGVVQKILIIQSSGFERLDQAAKNAVMEAKFYPVEELSGNNIFIEKISFVFSFE